MVDSVPPDEGCDMLDGEVANEEWNKNDNKNVFDSGESYTLVELEGSL